MEQFQQWIDDGNVIEISKGIFATQDALYRNRLVGKKELYRYYKKEFINSKKKRMEEIYKVFGLSERNVVTSAWLSSTGINVEEEHITMRHHQADFNSEHEAMDYVSNHDSFAEYYHGFEIVKTYLPLKPILPE